jgi:hypothetical protein
VVTKGKKIRQKAKIYLDKDGFLRYEESTKTTYDILVKNKKQVLNLVKKMKGKKKALIDLEGILLPPQGGRKVIVEMMKEANFEKVAVFHTSQVLRVMAKFISTAAKIKNFEFFDNKKEAISWLKK